MKYSPAHASSTTLVMPGLLYARPCSRTLISNRSSRHVCKALDESDKAMREAEKRWERSLAEGRVKNVSCQEAAELMKDGWKLLDVRPPTETEKVGVKGAIEIPLFVVDPAWDPYAILKKASAFGMGGWWLGGTHMVANNNFMDQVQAQVSRDDSVIVACQKGLRSLAASEQLSRAGYGKIAWINGGFDTDRGQLESGNGKDLRYAGIGGVSELVGWTEVQQQDAKNKGVSQNQFFKIAAIILGIDLLTLGYQWLSYKLQNP